MKKFILEWNNAEYPKEEFDTYEDAQNRGIDVGGQWIITEENK